MYAQNAQVAPQELCLGRVATYSRSASLAALESIFRVGTAWIAWQANTILTLALYRLQTACLAMQVIRQGRVQVFAITVPRVNMPPSRVHRLAANAPQGSSVMLSGPLLALAAPQGNIPATRQSPAPTVQQESTRPPPPPTAAATVQPAITPASRVRPLAKHVLWE